MNFTIERRLSGFATPSRATECISITIVPDIVVGRTVHCKTRNVGGLVALVDAF